MHEQVVQGAGTLLETGTTYYSHLTTHHSPLTTHHSPLTTHHSLLTTHHSLLTTHYSLLTAHCSQLTTYSLPDSGAEGAHPYSCTMFGGWLSTTPVPGILSPASTVDAATGLGTYYCGYQTSYHFKMVEFEMLISATSLYAKTVGAAYINGIATGDTETVYSSSARRSGRIAGSSTAAGYAIASLTYYTLSPPGTPAEGDTPSGGDTPIGGDATTVECDPSCADVHPPSSWGNPTCQSQLDNTGNCAKRRSGVAHLLSFLNYLLTKYLTEY